MGLPVCGLAAPKYNTPPERGLTMAKKEVLRNQNGIEIHPVTRNKIFYAPLTDGNTPGAPMQVSHGRDSDHMLGKGYTIHPASASDIKEACTALAKKKAADPKNRIHVAEAARNGRAILLAAVGTPTMVVNAEDAAKVGLT